MFVLWNVLFNIDFIAIDNYVCTLYFKVSLLQCNYTFKYWVILINYMNFLYGLDYGCLHVIVHN